MIGPQIACFGELLVRMTPSRGQALRDATSLDIDIGGAEANVAVALSNLGRRAHMISALPDSDLGALASKALRREDVDVSGIAIAPGRMGTYFLTPADAVRGGAALYDREGSAFACFGGYDMGKALQNCSHLHVSGISLAVSEIACDAALQLVSEAKTRDMTVSFDGNFRPALWKRQDRDPRSAIAEMVRMADMFFGNHKDIALLLERDFSGDGSERRREAALAAFEAFPNLTAIASTARHVEQGNSHRIVGRIDALKQAHESTERELSNIVDRIGTGDAFAAGVLHHWIHKQDELDVALEQGMALAALKHYTRGDFNRASPAELLACLEGGSDVRR